MPSRGLPRDRAIASAIERWFAANARDLPWRRPGAHHRRDPYRALVSEAMLQQTQVSRVVERFGRFIERFPTVQDLGAADEEDVLALWSGLGYYRRARLLHGAARAIVREHGGVFPTRLEEIRALPGVGRYTAGSIASLALGQRVPLVDGNVARVLLRLGARRGGAGDRGTDAWAWGRAGELVRAAGDPAMLNEGLMELGALVCAPPPAAPRCGECPLASMCLARREGLTRTIPSPKARTRQKRVYCATVLIRGGRASLAVERRAGGEGAARGMWEGMWQAPTLERRGRAPREPEILAWLAPGADSLRLVARTRFMHNTTHRRIRFDVWELAGHARSRPPPRGRWMTARHIAGLALSSAQRRILLPS